MCDGDNFAAFAFLDISNVHLHSYRETFATVIEKSVKNQTFSFSTGRSSILKDPVFLWFDDT
jgi:hypothetical protein